MIFLRMRKIEFKGRVGRNHLTLSVFVFLACFSLNLMAAPEFLLDMTHRNPGDDYPASKFVNPQFLASWGYNGQVIGSIGGLQTFDEIAPGLLPEGSAERNWALQHVAELKHRVQTAHAAGLKCFAGTDMILLPKKLIAKFKDEICDKQGRIDIERPKTREIFRALLRETFQRVPELDGIVVRTGEVYLQDFPYHAASGNFSDNKRQGGSAILHGEQSHIKLLEIFRDEVCAKLNKIVIYRTLAFWLGT